MGADMATYKIAFSSMAFDGKIPHGDPLWQEFNGSFENFDIDSLEIANFIYMGHPFTTWHKNKWRHSKNYELGQHLAIDFDTEDERSTLAHLAKDKFVQKYAHLIYTTPSHTPATPRARVLFTLDTPIYQAKNYALAASALLWLFGAADRQCKDACRFFYGSKNAEIEYLANELPLDVIKTLIKQYQVSGQVAKNTHERKNYTAPTDQKDVAEALRKIPPWGIEYDQWVSILMAIHHEFGDNGLGLAESWADGKPEEVRRKWRSFNENGNTSGKVTLGTLFAIAKEYGWERKNLAMAV